MQEGSLIQHLAILGGVILIGYALASLVLKKTRDLFNRPLLTGLFATVLLHVYIGVTSGLNARLLVGVVFVFLYGFVGGIVLEFIRRKMSQGKDA